MSNHLEHISAIHKPIWSNPVHDPIDGTIAAAIAVTIADETSGCCDGLYNDNERLFFDIEQYVEITYHCGQTCQRRCCRVVVLQRQHSLNDLSHSVGSLLLLVV